MLFMGLVKTIARETSPLSGIHWCEARMQPPFLPSVPCSVYDTALQSRFMYLGALSRIVFSIRRQGEERRGMSLLSS